MVDISRQVRKDGNVQMPEPLPVSSTPWIKESHYITRETLAERMPRLSWDTDTCVQCGECEAECPVQGIDLSSEPVRLQTPCIYCWRCVNVCPTQAISADWQHLVAAIPENYARYRKELDRATERGEFRWLIDPQTIDLTTPLYRKR